MTFAGFKPWTLTCPAPLSTKPLPWTHRNIQFYSALLNLVLWLTWSCCIDTVEIPIAQLYTKTDTTYFIFRMNGFPFSDMTIIVIAGATLLFSIVFLVISTYTSQSLSSYHLPSSQLNKCAYCFTTAVSIIIVVFNKYSKTFGVVFSMHRKDNSYIKNQVIDRCHKSWYIF